jgi:hypothetical protein
MAKITLVSNRIEGTISMMGAMVVDLTRTGRICGAVLPGIANLDNMTKEAQQG